MSASPQPQVAEFRHGAGRLSLDFVRTLRHRGTPEATDELADPTALGAWVREFGPCEPGPPNPALASASAQARLAAARTLREAIHELIDAARGPAGIRACRPAARQLINRVAAGPVPAPHLEPSGQLRWQADDPVGETLSLLARDALDLAASEAITRVRECSGTTCRALFLDTSRPGTRRWCSMDTCGNQAKKRNLRERR